MLKILGTTLTDVARAAGVSIATASRALGGRTVTSELHARIMAAATRLGYRANWAAKALASNRSGLVGLVVCASSGAHLEAVRTLEQRLGQTGYGCLISFEQAVDVRTALIDGLIDRGIEAIVFVGDSPRAQASDALLPGTLPWIAIAEEGEGDPRRIELGQAAGAELAVRYLRELNHERLATIGPPNGSTARGAARVLEGDTLSLTEALEWSDDPNAVKRAIHGLLDLPTRPTAIVCGNDAIALTAVRECILRGIRVPTDMSVVGFGDEPLGRWALPSLTTVRAAGSRAGVYAAEALLAMLAGQPYPPYQPPVKLAIRESSGPAPGGRPPK